MQNIKDSFFIAIRDRLAALNPQRTVTIQGGSRPAILVIENEISAAACLRGLLTDPDPRIRLEASKALIGLKAGDKKRVTVPGIPNGQPVKGRLTVPPSVPVTKSGDGKPAVVARPNRRIVIMPTDEEPQE